MDCRVRTEIPCAFGEPPSKFILSPKIRLYENPKGVGFKIHPYELFFLSPKFGQKGINMYYEAKYNDEIITYSVIQRECDNMASINFKGVFDDPRAYDEFGNIYHILRTAINTDAIILKINKPKSYMIRMCKSLLINAVTHGEFYNHNNLAVMSFLAIATYVFEHTRYFYTNTKDGSNAPKA